MTGPGTPGGPGGPGCPTPSLPGSPCKRRPRPACRLRAGAELCAGYEEAPGAPPRPESPTTSGSSLHVSEAPRVAPGSRPHTLSPTHFLPRGPLFSFWSLQRQEGKASSQAEHKPLPRDLRRAWQPRETHRQPGPRVLPRRTESRVRGPPETWVPPPAALGSHPPGLRPRPLCLGGQGTREVRLHQLLPAKDTRTGPWVRPSPASRCRGVTGWAAVGHTRLHAARGAEDRMGPGWRRARVAPTAYAAEPGGAGPRTRGNLGVPWGQAGPKF